MSYLELPNHKSEEIITFFCKYRDVSDHGKYSVIRQELRHEKISMKNTINKKSTLVTNIK